MEARVSILDRSPRGTINTITLPICTGRISEVGRLRGWSLEGAANGSNDVSMTLRGRRLQTAPIIAQTEIVCLPPLGIVQLAITDPS